MSTGSLPEDNLDNTIPADTGQTSDNERQVPWNAEEPSGSWKELAQVLDGLFFWVVLTGMTACTMIVALAPVYKHYSTILQ